MNVDGDALTAPILDRAQVAALRDGRARHRVPDERAPAAPVAPATGPWLALVVLGMVIVLAMLVLVVLLS